MGAATQRQHCDETQHTDAGTQLCVTECDRERVLNFMKS